MIVSALIYATGCQNRERILSKETEYEETHMKKMKMKIVECINNNDRKGLKKLFSKNAIEEVDDLDARIDKLLEVFSGKSIVSTEGEPVDSSRTNDYGKESISIYGEPPSGKTIPANGICLCRYEDVSRGSLQAPDIPIIER